MEPSDPGDDELLEYLGSGPAQRILDATALNEPISALQPVVPVCAELGTSVGDIVRLMQQHRIGCMLIVDHGKLVGIFTERDLLLKVIGSAHDLEKTPVQEVMTSAPEAMRQIDTVAFALNKMSLGGFRHIPVVDDAGVPVGIVSVKDIVDHIAEFFGAEVQNVPPVPALVAKHRDGA
jgi:CBS domain-containing protein